MWRQASIDKARVVFASSTGKVWDLIAGENPWAPVNCEVDYGVSVGTPMWGDLVDQEPALSHQSAHIVTLSFVANERELAQGTVDQALVFVDIADSWPQMTHALAQFKDRQMVFYDPFCDLTHERFDHIDRSLVLGRLTFSCRSFDRSTRPFDAQLSTEAQIDPAPALNPRRKIITRLR